MPKIRIAFRFFRVVALAAITMSIGACAPRQLIKTDYDYRVDFGQYKTYGYFSPLGIESRDYSTIRGSIFRQAIDIEMASRGYVKSETPDLLINVSGKLGETTRAGSGAGGYYDYRSGVYDAWGDYGFGASAGQGQYKEGTINIDLVDRAEKRMVWEGIAVGRVKPGASGEEARASIFSSVQAVFAAYPFRAGQ